MTYEEDIESLSVPIPGDLDQPDQYLFRENEEVPNRSLVRPDDIEQTIPDEDKPHLDASSGVGYWLEEGFSMGLIYRDRRSNEYRYYVVEPYLSEKEQMVVDFLNKKLIQDIEYDDIPLSGGDDDIERTVQQNLNQLLRRYSLVPRGVLQEGSRYYGSNAEEEEDSTGFFSGLMVSAISKVVRSSADSEDDDAEEDSDTFDGYSSEKYEEMGQTEIENIVDGMGPLSARQVDKIMYELSKEYVDYKALTPLLHDVNVEDISVDGWHQPVWVYHSDFGDIKTNIRYKKEDLDKTVKYMAESDGKGISKRQPTVNATLSDGSRVQLTLADEVSEKGSNLTIRQFRDVPFTPVDLINWETYSIEQMAYLWLCVENNQKILFAGGTGAGKTTTLNACSLFIPKEKIVSIEDTPELTLPHENWVQSTTREHMQTGDAINYQEFDLVEQGMRQRPSYIIVGEVRNRKAANALMQTIDTGHTAFSTFHGGSVDAVINRFVNDPINVAPAQFAAIDLICLQEQFHVDGERRRRTKSIVEIGEFSRENEHVTRNRLYEWDAANEEYIRTADSSNLLEDIRERRGWDDPEQLWDEFNRKQVVLSYLIRKGIQDYGDVAAVIQGYMRDPEAILALIAHEELEDNLSNLRKLDSLDLDIDEKAEEKLSRPVSEKMVAESERVLEENGHLVTECANYDIGDIFGVSADITDREAKYPFGERIKQAQEAAAEKQEEVDDTRFGLKDADSKDHFDAVRGSVSDDNLTGQQHSQGQEAKDDLNDRSGETEANGGSTAQSASLRDSDDPLSSNGGGAVDTAPSDTDEERPAAHHDPSSAEPGAQQVEKTDEQGQDTTTESTTEVDDDTDSDRTDDKSRDSSGGLLSGLNPFSSSGGNSEEKDEAVDAADSDDTEKQAEKDDVEDQNQEDSQSSADTTTSETVEESEETAVQSDVTDPDPDPVSNPFESDVGEKSGQTSTEIENTRAEEERDEMNTPSQPATDHGEVQDGEDSAHQKPTVEDPFQNSEGVADSSDSVSEAPVTEMETDESSSPGSEEGEENSETAFVDSDIEEPTEDREPPQSQDSAEVRDTTGEPHESSSGSGQPPIDTRSDEQQPPSDTNHSAHEEENTSETEDRPETQNSEEDAPADNSFTEEPDVQSGPGQEGRESVNEAELNWGLEGATENEGAPNTASEENDAGLEVPSAAETHTEDQSHGDEFEDPFKEIGQLVDQDDEDSDSSEDGNETTSDTEASDYPEEAKISREKRRTLLGMDIYGRQPEDVEVDPDDCDKILFETESQLYKQCQVPTSSDDDYCHIHDEDGNGGSNGGS